MNHHADYINAVALIAFALGFLGGMLWTVIGFRIGRWLKFRKIRRKRKMFRTRLRPLALVAFLLCSTAQAQIPIDILVAIEKAKADPVSPTTVKGSGRVEWKPYAEAHAAHLSLDKPMVIVIGASWCGPCQSLKREMESSLVADAHYAYLDVDSEKDLTRKLMIGSSIPQILIYRQVDGKWHKSHFSEKPQISFLKSTIEWTPPAKTQAVAYSYRVERIARPVGFQPAYVAGQTFYTHITRDHGHQIREVLNRVDIRGMSQDELFSLHSALHSGIRVGYWDGNCFVFQLP